MHRILERQVSRLLGTVLPENLPPQLATLLQAISDTYTHSDDDRTLLLRSLEISSKELVEVNKILKSENEIVEKKVAERTRELEYERIKLSNIAQHMSTGAILLDERGSVTFVNAAAMLLISPKSIAETIDALAKHFGDVSVRECVEDALQGKSADIPEAEADGKIFAISFVPLKSEVGIFGMLIWINDITAQRLLDRAKDQFISIASHEMRTPLAIIRGNAELLLGDETLRGNAELKDEADSILRGAIRLLDIVNDFLDVQHIEQQRIVLQAEPVDIVKALEATVKDLSSMAAEKHISLTIVPPTSAIPLLKLDHDRLQQICINVIANAIHYTDKGGVTVSFENRDGAVIILFQDTGVGIDPEDQTRIFKKFHTGKTFLRSKEYGSGLGLYISVALARAMGGDMRLKSSTRGVGSTFMVMFPLSLQV